MTREDLAQEEFEDMDENQIDEISKKKLSDYVNRSLIDLRNSNQAIGRRDKGKLFTTKEVEKDQGKEQAKYHDEHLRRSKNREKGIRGAVDRLAKEEFEDMDENQIDEASKKDYAHFPDANGHWHVDPDTNRRVFVRSDEHGVHATAVGKDGHEVDVFHPYGSDKGEVKSKRFNYGRKDRATIAALSHTGKKVAKGFVSNKLKEDFDEEGLDEALKIGDHVAYVGAAKGSHNFRKGRVYNILKIGNKKLHQVEFHTSAGGFEHELGQGRHAGNYRPHELKKINEDQIDETIGSDSLHPNTNPVNDAKSKVETLKAMIGAANAMTNTELTKWFTSMIDQYPEVSLKAPGSADANRATVNMKAGGKPLAPQAMVKIKEDMDSLFEGQDLSEDLKERITTLFEAAVSVRAEVVAAELEEAYEVALQEEVADFIAETNENIDSYLSYAVDQWISENEVAIVDSLRLENAENFMNSLKDLMIESHFDLPEERVDVVAEMGERLAELEGRLSETIAENLEMRRSIEGHHLDDLVAEASKGLTLMDVERFRGLVESVEYTSDEDYKKKLSIIRESNFVKSKSRNGSIESLNESDLSPAETQRISSDPFVSSTMAYINKSMPAAR